MENYTLTVGFRTCNGVPISIPPETLAPLAVSVQKLILDHFAAANKDAQAAFEAHKRCPYPGDDVQQVLREVDNLMHKCLDRDYGPTAVRNLHPVVSFEHA